MKKRVADNKRIAALFEERTNLKASEIVEFFRQQQTKDANFAAQCGIVQEIRDVNIPAGSTIIPLMFQR